MAVSDYALVTLAAAKAYLQKTDPSHDQVLEMLIDAVTAKIEGHIGRLLAKRTYTAELYDGTGREWLWLPAWPIAAVTSIYEDDVLLTVGADYDYVIYSDLGGIKRAGYGGYWLEGHQVVKVTYTGGYVVQDAAVATGETALPADLKLAALMQVAMDYQLFSKKDWGESSRSFPDGSVSKHMDPGALMPEVKQMLSRHVKIRI